MANYTLKGQQNSREVVKLLLEKFDEVTPVVKKLVELGLGTLALDGKIERLQEQRKFIGQVLQAFQSAGATPVVEPPSDASTPIKVVFSLGVINRELGRALRYPQLSAMVLENERLRIQIVGLQQQAANAQARLALMKRQRDAMVAEASWLVKTNVARAEMTAECKADTIHATFRDKVDCREQIVRTLTHYANSWSVGRVIHEEIESQLIGLRHEAALDNSEIALAHWHNLIGIPLGQFEALYESGLKPNEIAQFLHAIANAAGLTFIGVRLD
jgi:hypothetical protein